MRVQSARMLDDRSSWSFDAKDSTSTMGSAVLQAQSPQPLLEERHRRTSTKRSTGHSKDNKSSYRKHSTDSSTVQRTCTNTAETVSSHELLRPALQLSDHELAERARAAAATIEWDTLRARSSVWDKKKNLGDFGVYTRRCGRAHQIMASGSVACSITELQHILCTTSNARYAAAMSELHGPSFLSGAVVHKINTHLLREDGSGRGDNQEHHAVHADASSRKASSSSSRSRDGRSCFDLTIKTATFAKAHVFARNEHWCFFDFFQPQSDKQKFILSMHSLHSDDVLLPRGAASGQAAAAKQLQEVSAGYSVVADARRKLVWVVFFAQYVEPATGSSGSLASGLFSKRQNASKSAAMARLMKMAKAACYLPMIVHRRRLGAQVFIDHDAFSPPNTHCICCTAALALLARKQRCHLCGYCVCDRCSSKHELERAHTHLVPVPQRPVVRVCLTCTRRVNGANYDNIPMGATSPSAIERNAPDSPPPNVVLAGLLRDSFENAADEAKKRAVLQVIKNLLEPDDDSGGGASGTDPSNHVVLIGSGDDDDDGDDGASGDDDHPNQALFSSATTTSSRSDLALVDALATDLRVREFALDECVLGNATSRNYALTYTDERDVDAPAFPVPDCEATRLASVRERRLSDIKNIPELEIICSIARKELQCPTGLVTVVEKGEVHVIASSNELFQNVVVPRSESICAHAIMSDKPLLVPFVDADVRFNRIGAVQQGALNYYCGFPLVLSDNSVVGTVCCIDNEDHVVTQSQYAVMTKLAATAARVMEMRAKVEAAA